MSFTRPTRYTRRRNAVILLTFGAVITAIVGSFAARLLMLSFETSS